MEQNKAKLWSRALASRYLYAWVPYLRYVGLNGSLARGDATKSEGPPRPLLGVPGSSRSTSAGPFAP